MIFESSWYFDDGSWEVVIWVPTLQPFKTFYDTMNLAGQRPKKRKEWQPTQLGGSGRGGEKHRHGPGRGWDWEVPFKVSLCFAMFRDVCPMATKLSRTLRLFVSYLQSDLPQIPVAFLPALGPLWRHLRFNWTQTDVESWLRIFPGSLFSLL